MLYTRGKKVDGEQIYKLHLVDLIKTINFWDDHRKHVEDERGNLAK